MNTIHHDRWLGTASKLVSKLLRTPAFLPLLRMRAKAKLRRTHFVMYLEPQDYELRSAVCTINGWCAWTGTGQVSSLRIGGVPVKWIPVDRPDVERIFGGEQCLAFRAFADITPMLVHQAESGNRLILDVVMDDRPVGSAELQVTAAAISQAAVSGLYRSRKREWLKIYAACPLCPPGTGRLDFADDAIRCRACGETFPNEGPALDLLPNDTKRKFRIEDAGDISVHRYDDVAKGILENVRRGGGKVLDCGSGMRPMVDETVICLDIADYPTVDIKAVNQRLPFQDAVFDAVFSLNVLEHVTDPFACASELIRVLKPGGTLYCCIPFLQPEHGYPHHYFNATRAGLRQLFPLGLELIDQFVPRSGEPVWGLHWFLSWYVKELPTHERQRFLNMRVQDLIERPAAALLDAPWVAQLSTEGKWQLACTTAAVFKKTDARAGS